MTDTGLPLWDRQPVAQPVRAMHRGDDPQTSIDAARRVRRDQVKLRRIHGTVLRAILKNGPMTDGELERLEVFADLGPSTVRKRRGELYQAGHLATHGRRSGMTVWELATRARKTRKGAAC